MLLIPFAYFTEMHWGNHDIVSPTYSKKVIPLSLDLTLYMQRQRFNLGKVEQWWRHHIFPRTLSIDCEHDALNKKIYGIFLRDVSKYVCKKLAGIFRLCEVRIPCNVLARKHAAHMSFVCSEPLRLVGSEGPEQGVSCSLLTYKMYCIYKYIIYKNKCIHYYT